MKLINQLFAAALLTTIALGGCSQADNTESNTSQTASPPANSPATDMASNKMVLPPVAGMTNLNMANPATNASPAGTNSPPASNP
jgi:hypothetical protein